jgi:hypothetical protein
MKILLKVLVAIIALGLSVSAAYFSVLGLTKMFAGAVMGTAIVCSFIEASKLVIASVLHQFSKSLNWFTKISLTFFLLLSMAITSMGVYGYLTNAFQGTANQMEIIDGQTKVIQLKRDRFQESLNNYIAEKKDLTTSITELTKGLSNNVIRYTDRETGEVLTRTSSSTRKVLNGQLNDAKLQRDVLSLKVASLTDSVTTLDFQMLDLNSNEELAAEIGPLKFISELSGLELNVIVNFLTLLLVFIIDPMAIMLVIVFNKINRKEGVVTSVPLGKEFNKPYPIPEELYDEDVDLSKIEFSEKDIASIQNIVKDTPIPNSTPSDATKRYDDLMKEHTDQVTLETPGEFYGEKKRTKRVG